MRFKAVTGAGLIIIALLLTIMGSSRIINVAASVAPDLNIEGVVLPYTGLVVPLIYPTPQPWIYYNINVSVANQGSADAGSFNVSFTVHLEGDIKPEYERKKTIAAVQQGASESFLFDFNPQDYGNYTLTITADSDNDIVELDETNNTWTVWMIGTIRGDMDGDGDVDYDDLIMFAGAYGIWFEIPPYPRGDFDWDGDSDYDDFIMFAGNYGMSI